MSLDHDSKSVYHYLCVAGKVFKDKCWYTLWNFDLFTPVNRIYPEESYYSSFYYLLTMEPHKVDHNIYLGSAFNAADKEWLEEREITSVVNVTPSISNYYPDDYTYYNYGATDLSNSSLLGFYERFYRLLTENPDEVWFVHCFAGKSRSVALVLYYLMRTYDLSLERAIRHLKRCRPCININQVFIDEIKSLTQTSKPNQTSKLKPQK